MEKKIDQLLERIVDADTPSVIKMYERKIGEREREKLTLVEKIDKCGMPQRDYDHAFQTAFSLLANPWKLWETGKLEDRQAMLKLVFAGELVYERKSGFQTPQFPYLSGP